MLIDFFLKLKECQGPGHDQGIPHAHRGHAKGRGRLFDRRFLLFLEDLSGQGRGQLRQVRPRLRRVFQGRRGHHGRGSRHSARVAAQAGRAQPESGGKSQDRGHGRLGKAHGNAEKTPGGTKRQAPGRQQMDRHRRHLALRRLRLQPRRHTHRPGRLAQPLGGESVGPARVPEPGRPGGTRNAQHQDRAEKAAPLRPRRRARGARSGRHHRLHREKSRDARHPDAARAPQQGQGAAVFRHRRLDGRPHQAVPGDVFRGQDRIQAHGVFLLPQLPVRLRVEGQPPPPLRAHPDLGHPAQVRARLQTDLSSATPP